MSKLIPEVRVEKIDSAVDGLDALSVIDEVYAREKGWIKPVNGRQPGEYFGDPKTSWFLARVNRKPAGVLRLLYDPVMELPQEYGVTLKEGVDLHKMASLHRFVEIGRFCIKPRFRKNIFVALRLMRAAITEVVEREYTHFITDVFEGESNSPLNFHTRILGFEVIGRHLHGDLNCSCTRIILTLDIMKAYARLKAKGSRILASLTDGLEEVMSKRLGTGN